MVRYQVLHREARRRVEGTGDKVSASAGERLREGRVGQATKLRMDEAMRVRVEAMHAFAEQVEAPIGAREREERELADEGGS